MLISIFFFFGGGGGGGMGAGSVLFIGAGKCFLEKVNVFRAGICFLCPSIFLGEVNIFRGQNYA